MNQRLVEKERKYPISSAVPMSAASAPTRGKLISRFHSNRTLGLKCVLLFLFRWCHEFPWKWRLFHQQLWRRNYLIFPTLNTVSRRFRCGLFTTENTLKRSYSPGTKNWRKVSKTVHRVIVWTCCGLWRNWSPLTDFHCICSAGAKESLQHAFHISHIYVTCGVRCHTIFTNEAKVSNQVLFCIRGVERSNYNVVHILGIFIILC